MKIFSIACAISVLLIACGESKVEHQQADEKLEKQNIEAGQPELVETDVVGDANPLPGNSVTISGDITYQGQTILPENAKLVVRLVEKSEPGNVATTLLSEPYILEGPPPYSYELNYEQPLTNEKGSYIVQAVIVIGEDAAFRGAKKIGLSPGAEATLSLDLVEVKEDQAASE